MHVDAERAAEPDPRAARTCPHGFEKRALRVVKLVLGQFWQAIIQFLGGHRVLVPAASQRLRGRKLEHFSMQREGDAEAVGWLSLKRVYARLRRARAKPIAASDGARRTKSIAG